MGIVNVDEMLATIPSRLIIEWMAFFGLEPFGFEAQMYGHALTAVHLINAFKDKKSPTVKIEQLMPKIEKGGSRQSVDEMLAFAQAQTVARGGKDKRPKDD